MVYMYRNASKMLCCWIHKICQNFEMHQYIFISIFYWKNKQQWPTSFNMKNHSAKQKSCDKKGSRAKKLQWNGNKKCFMCEWDHWNNIGTNPARYRNKFATSKSRRIRVMCVKALTLDERVWVHSWWYSWVCVRFVLPLLHLVQMFD